MAMRSDRWQRMSADDATEFYNSTEILIDYIDMLADAFDSAEAAAFDGATEMPDVPPARQLDPVTTDARVAKAVLLVVGTFFGESNVSKSILGECCDLFMQHFSSLEPEEIVTAFRMAAALELNVGVALTGSKFTVALLGTVLSAYRVHRSKAAKKEVTHV